MLHKSIEVQVTIYLFWPLNITKVYDIYTMNVMSLNKTFWSSSSTAFSSSVGHRTVLGKEVFTDNAFLNFLFLLSLFSSSAYTTSAVWIGVVILRDSNSLAYGFKTRRHKINLSCLNDLNEHNPKENRIRFTITRTSLVLFFSTGRTVLFNFKLGLVPYLMHFIKEILKGLSTISMLKFW